MSELKNLVCTSSDIRFPEQVKRIRADLNILGYDADEQTIQRAYEEWSEDYWASSWDDYSGQVDRLDMLLADYLKVSPVSPPELPPVSPEDLVEGEWYYCVKKNWAGFGKTAKDMWMGRETGKMLIWIGEADFSPDAFTIYGPLKFKIGGAE